MEHTKHLWRAGLLLVLALVAFVLVRHFLIPETFGQDGYYRYASLAEFRALPVMHGAPASCKACHEGQHEAHAEGKHQSVDCQYCHGPLRKHVQGQQVRRTDEYPELINRSIELCKYCHLKLPTREKLLLPRAEQPPADPEGPPAGPKPLPQLAVFRDHLIEQLDPDDPAEVKVPKNSNQCLLCHPMHKAK